MASITRSLSPSQSSAVTLRRKIHSIVNRIRVIGAVHAICWSITLFCSGLVLVAWMDIIWHLPIEVRRAAIPFVLLSAAALFSWLFRDRWMSATNHSVARRMDKVAGTGGQILSGWDLLTDDRSESQPPLGKDIALVAIDQASRRASKVAARDAAPWRESRASVSVAAAVCLVTAVFAMFASHAFATSWKRLAMPSVDTPPYSPLVFEVSPGNVQITYGKPLEVTALITGGAIEDATLVLGDPDDSSVDRVAMFPRGGGRWQAVLPRVIDPTRYCVTAERGRSETFHVEVLETPQIESVRFTITPPVYTNLPKRKGRHPQDRIAGLLQTKVALEITANRPLAKGSVRIQSVSRRNGIAEAITLQVSPLDRQRVTGLVTIKHSGQWQLSVTGSNGIATESPVTLEVELLVDRPPIVRIAQPQSKSYATPDTKIPVAVVGEDDFGISRMRLYRIIDGSRPIPLELPVESATRLIQGNSVLPLDAFGLQPGDKITLLARVDDTRPDIIQGGESPVAEIEIISQRDFDRLIAARQGQQMLENKFRQARRMMDRLATELAELQQKIDQSDPNDAEQQKKLQDRMSQLQQKMNDVADELDKLAQQELPLEIDQHWNELLRQQAESLRAAAAMCKALNKEGKTT